MTGLFARHRGRHCRHGSVTGWAALAALVPVPRPVDDFTRPRPVPVVWPMTAPTHTNPLENTR